MKSVFLQPGVIIASLFIIVLLGGGTYVGIRSSADSRDKDALVSRGRELAAGHASAEQVAAELARARSVAAAELERLDLFTNYSGSPEALAAVREEVYENVLTVIMKEADAAAAAIKLTEKASVAAKKLADEITANRQEIKTILEQWKALISDPVASVAPDAKTKTAAYAEQVQEYIEALGELVDQLTPENSGLTGAQIDTIQDQIDTLVEETTQAVSDISQPTVPPHIVTEQKEEVQNAADTVNDIEEVLEDIVESPGSVTPPSGSITPTPEVITAPPGTSSGGSGTGSTFIGTPSTPVPGTRYVPPLAPVDPSKPKLIEGTNVDL